jgi:hypothetical protein
VFARDLQGELGDPYTRSRNYHLFLDGQYWGIYMTQERVQEDYAATYFGGEPEDYDVVKHGVFDGGGTQIAEGNDLAWRQLFDLAQGLANSPTLLANNYWTMQGLNPDGTRNTDLPVLLDVDNLINYWLIIVYTGGFDTGISRFLGENEANNWQGVYNRVTKDQGFQFFIHDNEHSLGAEEGGSLHGTQFIDRTGPFNAGNQSNYAYFNPVYLHQDLLAHPDYRQRIIEKVGEYFFNDGPMTPAASIARMQERISEVEPAIIAESARWGDSKRSTPLNKSDWQLEINWLLNTYVPTRTSTVINQLVADKLWVSLPSLSPPGGNVPPGSTLTISGAIAGTIYYTTDGSDPRLDGGINPTAIAYTGPISLNASPTITARLRLPTGEWSNPVSASYQVFISGDYDDNGVVDGGDFLAWQRALGTSVANAGEGADGNFSYWVDAGDLVVWQNNYGVGHNPSELAAVVLGAEAFDEAVAVESASDNGTAADSLSLPKSVLLDLVGESLASRDGVGAGAVVDAALTADPTVASSTAVVGRVAARESAARFAPARRLQYAAAERDDVELVVALDAALAELL